MKNYLLILTVFFVVSFLFIPTHKTFAASHPVGTNVKFPNGTIYLIVKDGTLRPYKSVAVFSSYKFNDLKKVVKANSEDRSLIIRAVIPPQDGSMICSNKSSDNGTCYFISQGEKYAFLNDQVFKELGYNFKNAKKGDVSYLPLAQVKISSSVQAHPPGTLVINGENIMTHTKDMWLVGYKGLYHFPETDLDILKSWGYNISNAVWANEADRLLPPLNSNNYYTFGYTTEGLLPIGGLIKKKEAGELNILDDIDYKDRATSALIPNLDTQKRDLARLSDIYTLNNAIKTFYILNEHYPATLADLVPSMISPELPTAPEPADGVCSSYDNLYTYTLINSSTYQINFCLGSQVNNVPAGINKIDQDSKINEVPQHVQLLPDGCLSYAGYSTQTGMPCGGLIPAY